MNVRSPSRCKANQYAAWMTCLVCGLRLCYKPAPGLTGKTRAAGPTPDVVQQAQKELQQEGWENKDYPLFNKHTVEGKIDEINGEIKQRRPMAGQKKHAGPSTASRPESAASSAASSSNWEQIPANWAEEAFKKMEQRPSPKAKRPSSKAKPSTAPQGADDEEQEDPEDPPETDEEQHPWEETFN